MGGSKIVNAKNACKSMINEMIDFKYHKLSLISFQSSARILSNLTNNKNILIKELSSLRAGGGTCMSSALSMASSILNSNKNSQALIPYHNNFKKDNRNKIVILVTDGQDGCSNQSLIESNDLKNKNTKVVTIGVGGGVNQNFLGNLASSQNDYYFIRDFSQLSNIFKSIMNGLQVK